MPLEATVICLDNSEYMRNGDYMPTRIEAQQDAVNLICAAKTQQNPESTVAVMTSSPSKNGARAEVLVTLTQDLGKILSSIHSVKVGGEGDLSSAIQVAQLVLKHRQNKNQHQRIVAFVGSPVKESVDDLVKLGKKLKKNNIAVDIVNFGEEQQNIEKLEAFFGAVNTNDESHIVTIPPGPHILSDILLSSAIVSGEGGGGGFAASAAAAAAHASGAAGGEFDFGVDPTLDPELAMAIRMSLEEERARQAAAAAAAAAAATDQKPEEGQKQEGTAPAPTADVEMADYDDDLKQAMQMSMGGTASSPMDLSEEEQMQIALQMSVHGAQQQQPQTTAQPPAGANTAASLHDQDFLNSVLSSLPGVDPNDERIRGVLSSIGGEKKEEKKDEEKK